MADDCDAFCKSKKENQKLLEKHVGELSSLQRLRYASNRYALLLVFQAMDAAGPAVKGVGVVQRAETR